MRAVANRGQNDVDDCRCGTFKLQAIRSQVPKLGADVVLDDACIKAFQIPLINKYLNAYTGKLNLMSQPGQEGS